MKQDLNQTRLDRSTNKDVQDWLTIDTTRYKTYADRE